MADDQNQKPSTIDDLVKQLSNQPPSNLPGIKIDPEQSREGSQRASASYEVENKPEPSQIQPQPSFNRPQIPVTPPPIRPPLSSQVPQPPRPQPSLPPKPSTSPLPSTRPAIPAQEYKSSIRTMSEDLSSIKSGQKPAGIDIPRKILPEQPKVELPPLPPPLIGGQKSSVSPIPRVGLGRPEKSAPLPSVSIPAMPKGPVPSMPKPSTQPSIAVPGVKRGLLGSFSLGRKTYTLVVGIVGILVAGGFLYWLLVLRTKAPEIITSPTPSPVAVPTPIVKNLNSIFEGIPVNFEVAQDENVGSNFKTFVGALNVTNKEFLKVDLAEDFQGTLVPVSFLDVFDIAPVVYPAGLRDNVTDSVVLVYGQSEGFDSNGNVNLNVQGLKKTVFMAKVKNGTAVESVMKDWELSIANDLADYLLIPKNAKETSVNFLDNTYRNTQIRYKNFPFPDITVDYSVISIEGQSYLVIAGSREAIYNTIDVLANQ